MQNQFKISSEYLESLRKRIRSGDTAFLRSAMAELFPVDIAGILDKLDPIEAKVLYTHLDEDEAGTVLIEMDEDARDRLLASLSSKEIAEQFIDNLNSNDAADIIGDLPDNVQSEILSHMEDAGQASNIAELLKFDKDSAGGLMAKELVRVNINMNVLECVRQMRRQAMEMESVYAVYAVDDDDRLIGILPLQKLLTTPVRSKIVDVIEADVISVKTNTPSEEVGQIMDKYDLVVLPVVDQMKRLVGTITIDDVVDVIRKEQTEDIQKIGGMEAIDSTYMNTRFSEMIRKRSPWLIVLLIGESFTATAMSFFEDQIAQAVVLALFVPLIISSGGNTGSQASTLIVRALALNEISLSDWWKILRRELKVGLVLGIILGIVGFIRVAIWSEFLNSDSQHWIPIALTIGSSLVGVVLWGNIIGSLLPIVLKRMNLDPAVSSAPFVATIVDVTGVIIYFSLAAFFLRGIFV